MEPCQESPSLASCLDISDVGFACGTFDCDKMVMELVKKIKKVLTIKYDLYIIYE